MCDALWPSSLSLDENESFESTECTGSLPKLNWYPAIGAKSGQIYILDTDGCRRDSSANQHADMQSKSSKRSSSKTENVNGGLNVDNVQVRLCCAFSILQTGNDIYITPEETPISLPLLFPPLPLLLLPLLIPGHLVLLLFELLLCNFPLSPLFISFCMLLLCRRSSARLLLWFIYAGLLLGCCNCAFDIGHSASKDSLAFGICAFGSIDRSRVSLTTGIDIARIW